MTLTKLQLRQREGRLTASRVGVLMSGDPEKVLALWMVMTGQIEEDDLSDVWAVQLGSATEALNLDWYAKKFNPVTRRGEVCVSPIASWAASTLDGFDAALPGPVECKHVGGYEARETIIARYQPQIHWQMRCTSTMKAAFSIIEGAREPVRELVEYDIAYGNELWTRAKEFMHCVDDLVPPVELPEVAPPLALEQMRTVDMSRNNTWRVSAAAWLQNRDAAKMYEASAKELKALVEPDVALATGAGIQAKRSKSGALTISAVK